MICTAWSPAARVLTKTVMRRRAPVASMKVICRMDVKTMRETGKEAMTPAADDRSPTSGVVLKKRQAMGHRQDPADDTARIGGELAAHHQVDDHGDRQKDQEDRREHQKGLRIFRRPNHRLPALSTPAYRIILA